MQTAPWPCWLHELRSALSITARLISRSTLVLARTAGRGTFVPLTFAPGEAFQFDWSEDWATVAGERVKLQVAQFKLSHSRAFLLRAYLLQTHEMLFDAHVHAFAVLGGVPRRGIYDNIKTAVDRVRVGVAPLSARLGGNPVAPLRNAASALINRGGRLTGR